MVISINKLKLNNRYIHITTYFHIIVNNKIIKYLCDFLYIKLFMQKLYENLYIRQVNQLHKIQASTILLYNKNLVSRDFCNLP